MAIKIQNNTVIDDSRAGNLLSLTIAQNAGSGASFLKIPFYASADLRDAAITSPEVGMVCVTAGQFLGYDGTKWGSIVGGIEEDALCFALIDLN